MMGQLHQYLHTQRARRMLRRRIPEGRQYTKEGKVQEFLSRAVSFLQEGYDFTVIYRSEQGHYETVPDKVVRTESNVDSGQYMGYGKAFTTLHYESGKTFSWHSDDEWTEGFKIPEPGTYNKWVVDEPEFIDIERGKRLT